MNCYFIANAQSVYFESKVFQAIMQYVAKEGHFSGLSMKQSNNYLIMTKENVKTLKEAQKILQNVADAVIVV